MKTMVALTVAAMLITPSFAATCRDAKGKFVKCPTAAAAVPTVTKDAKGKCHGAKGKFVACPK